MSFFAAVPTGTVLDFAGQAAPRGFLLCFGQAVSRATYKKLFDSIGTAFGVGDGSTTFGLPDVRGRVVAGADNMGGAAASRLTLAIAGFDATVVGTAGAGGSQSLHAHTHSATGLTVSGTNVQSAISGTANTGVNLTHSHGITDPSHAHIQNIQIGFNQGAGPYHGSEWLGDSGRSTPYDTQASTTGISINNSTSLDHSHSVTGTAVAQAWSGAVAGATASTGAGASQNVQPTIVFNKIIKI